MPKLVKIEKGRLEWDYFSISEKYDFFFLWQIGEGLWIDMNYRMEACSNSPFQQNNFIFRRSVLLRYNLQKISL